MKCWYIGQVFTGPKVGTAFSEWEVVHMKEDEGTDSSKWAQRHLSSEKRDDKQWQKLAQRFSKFVWKTIKKVQGFLNRLVLIALSRKDGICNTRPWSNSNLFQI